jgi:hypothetical protein
VGCAVELAKLSACLHTRASRGASADTANTVLCELAQRASSRARLEFITLDHEPDLVKAVCSAAPGGADVTALVCWRYVCERVCASRNPFKLISSTRHYFVARMVSLLTRRLTSSKAKHSESAHARGPRAAT